MSKKTVLGTTSVGVLSSIFAFLGVVSCCGMPIVAAILAWLGIGASQLSFLAEYRSLFIGISIIALLVGFWQTYLKQGGSCCTTTTSCCTEESSCSTAETSCCAGVPQEVKPKSNRVQKIVLWVGAALIISLLITGNETTPEPDEALPAASLHHESKPTGCCPE